MTPQQSEALRLARDGMYHADSEHDACGVGLTAATRPTRLSVVYDTMATMSATAHALRLTQQWEDDAAWRLLRADNAPVVAALLDEHLIHALKRGFDEISGARVHPHVGEDARERSPGGVLDLFGLEAFDGLFDDVDVLHHVVGVGAILELLVIELEVGVLEDAFAQEGRGVLGEQAILVELLEDQPYCLLVS